MKRFSQDEKKRASARIAEEAGFTLIELLVAMVIAVIVIGTGTYGIARAFEQSTQISSRTSSANQAESGLQHLTQDLRFATTCPTYSGTNTLGANGDAVSGVLASAGPEVQMCGQIPGSSTQPPALALISWTCNTTATADTCTRSFSPLYCPTTGGGTAPATGNCTLGVPTAGKTSSTSTSIYGVTSATFSGLVGGANQTSLLSGPSSCGVANSYENYVLVAGTCSLSYVQISLAIVTLNDPGSPSDASNTKLDTDSQSVQIQTAAALRNYGL